jgi:hypothetical protein
VRVPGSADAVVRALDAAIQYHEGGPAAVDGALRVLAKALLCNLGADGSPPGTEEALAEWRAAARGASAVPALRLVLESRLGRAPGIRVLAASAAALLELMGRQPCDLAAAGDAPQELPPRDAPGPDEVPLAFDAVVVFATEALFTGLEGAPAHPLAERRRGNRARAGRTRGLERACRRAGRPRCSTVGARRDGRAPPSRSTRARRAALTAPHRPSATSSGSANPARAPVSDGEVRATALQTFTSILNTRSVRALMWLSAPERGPRLVAALRAAALQQPQQGRAAAVAASHLDSMLDGFAALRQTPGAGGGGGNGADAPSAAGGARPGRRASGGPTEPGFVAAAAATGGTCSNCGRRAGAMPTCGGCHVAR